MKLPPKLAQLMLGVALACSPAAVARAQRKKVERGQLALDQILDRLEHGEMRSPRSPLIDFLSSVR